MSFHIPNHTPRLIPQTQTRQETEFVDVMLGTNIMEIEVYRKAIRLHLSDGNVVVLKKRALRQLLRFIDMKVKDLEKTDRDQVREKLFRLFKEKNLVARCLVMQDGALYATRVTSPDYTAIPHTTLFSYVASLLNNNEYKVVNYPTRTVALWKLYEIPVEYANINDVVAVYIGVSNANTGEHSIKVFGFLEILSCENGLVSPELVATVRIRHVGSMFDILSKVGDAVKEVIDKMKSRIKDIPELLKKLDSVRIDDTALDRWLQDFLKKMPKKYHPLVKKVFNENRARFGNTLQTVFQTVTALIPRVRSYDMMERLSRVAYEILVTQNLRR